MAHFADPKELANHVVASLANELLQSAPEDVPELLPYEVDRTLQEARVERWLAERRREATGRPWITVLHGPDNESLEMLLRRLAHKVLPAVFPGERVCEKNFGWPNDKHLRSDEGFDLLRYGLAKSLDAGAEATAQDLHAAICTQPGTIVLSTSLLSTHWRPEWESWLGRYLDLWDELPPLPEGRRLVVTLLIATALAGSTEDGGAQPVTDAIERVTNRSGVLVVPRLGPVPRGDALAWVSLDEVGRWSHGRTEELRDEILKFYGDAAEKPMREVGQKLYALLQSCQPSRRQGEERS